jgi:hypothetical protein
MDREKLREAYLAQAKAVGEKAEMTTDPAVKECLQKVAIGFRTLARQLVRPHP